MIAKEARLAECADCVTLGGQQLLASGLVEMQRQFLIRPDQRLNLAARHRRSVVPS